MAMEMFVNNSILTQLPIIKRKIESKKQEFKTKTESSSSPR